MKNTDDNRGDIPRFTGFMLILALGLTRFSTTSAHPGLWDPLAFTLEGFRETVNTFSFTSPVSPWINHEWLSLFLLNHLYTFSGGGGVLVVQTLCGFWLLLICSAPLRGNIRAGAARLLLTVLLAMAVSGGGFRLTPAVFSWILFAWLAKQLRRPRLPLLFPALAILLGCLWANLHGTFFTGQVLLTMAALCAAAEAIRSGAPVQRQTALTLGSSASGFFLGTLFTPYGLHPWSLVFRTAGFCRVSVLTGNTPFTAMTGFPANIAPLILAGLAIAGVTVYRNNRLFPLGVLATAAAGMLAGQHFMPFFAISVLIFAPEAIASLIQAPLESVLRRCPPVLLKAVLASVALLMALTVMARIGSRPGRITIPETEYPTAAVAFLERNSIEANGLIHHPWSGMTLARLYPKVRPFLDSRLLAAYPAPVINDYLLFTTGRSRHALDAYPVDLVLMPTGGTVAARMQAMPAWTAIYGDSTSIVFIRNDAHEDVLRRHAMNMLFLPAYGPTVFP